MSKNQTTQKDLITFDLSRDISIYDLLLEMATINLRLEAKLDAMTGGLSQDDAVMAYVGGASASTAVVGATWLDTDADTTPDLPRAHGVDMDPTLYCHATAMGKLPQNPWKWGINHEIHKALGRKSYTRNSMRVMVAEMVETGVISTTSVGGARMLADDYHNEGLRSGRVVAAADMVLDITTKDDRLRTYLVDQGVSDLSDLTKAVLNRALIQPMSASKLAQTLKADLIRRAKIAIETAR